jgi:hypothetical protein
MPYLSPEDHQRLITQNIEQENTVIELLNALHQCVDALERTTLSPYNRKTFLLTPPAIEQARAIISRVEGK